MCCLYTFVCVYLDKNASFQICDTIPHFQLVLKRILFLMKGNNVSACHLLSRISLYFSCMKWFNSSLRLSRGMLAVTCSSENIICLLQSGFQAQFLVLFPVELLFSLFCGEKARVIFMIVLKVCFHFAWWLFLSFYTLFWFNTLSSLHNILPSLARFSDSVVFDPFNICRYIYFALFCRDEFLLFVFIYCSVCLALWNQMPFINVSHLTFFISSCAQ